MQGETKEIKLNSEDIQQDSNKHKYPLQTKKKKKKILKTVLTSKWCRKFKLKKKNLEI